ncbi:Superoxide-generating NADPH oxidase heavy chain subunit A [Porphyridium purpureum]|uniref:Superoxide-generating NADPH oxidase heavy chain subunit A n=1 Tax=Porphyridium purpureum TaxID=35688 RepID=A0A5J4Z2F2_PORPP|nr:Superoxide-generating NADPH oxidase heavy chain subunit A [Porphyridium purpureum]|eukprot:POR9383..scf208_2
MAGSRPTRRRVLNVFWQAEHMAQERAFELTLLLAYAILNVTLFLLGASDEMDKDYDGAKGVLLPIARGFGASLNLNCALVLLPVLHALWTWVQSTRASFFVRFDRGRSLHALIGLLILIGAIGHGALQLTLYVIYAPWSGGVTGATSEFATGVLMWVTLGLLSVVPLRKVRGHLIKFETFWVVHITGAVFFFATLILHGQHNRRLSTWYFVLPGILLYVLDIAVRLVRKKRNVLPVHMASLRASEAHKFVVVELPMCSAQYRAGQYFKLNIPELGRFQWHPFSPISSPGDDRLVFVIKVCGDWTLALFDLVRLGRTSLFVSVSGPFGSPSALSWQFEHIVFVGGGIGCTPMVSLIRDHVHQLHTTGGRKSIRESCRLLDPPSSDGLGPSSDEADDGTNSISAFHVERCRDGLGRTTASMDVDLESISLSSTATTLSDVPPRPRALSFYVTDMSHVCTGVLAYMLPSWVQLVRVGLLLAMVTLHDVHMYSEGFMPYSTSAIAWLDFALSLVALLVVSVILAASVWLRRFASWLDMDTIILFCTCFTSSVLGLLNQVCVSLKIHGAVQLVVLIPLSIVCTSVHLFRSWRHMLLLGDVGCMKTTERETKTVDFVWVTPEQNQDHWLLRELSDLNLKPLHGLRFWRFVSQAEYSIDDTDVEVFLQAPGTANQPSSPDGSAEEGVEPPVQRVLSGAYLDHMSSFAGRPNWDELFDEIAGRFPAKAQVGVFCCGPPGLGKDVRKACARWRIRSLQSALEHAHENEVAQHIDQIGLRILFRSECFY